MPSPRACPLDEVYRTDQYRPVVPGADRGDRQASRLDLVGLAYAGRRRLDRHRDATLRFLKRKGFSDRTLAKSCSRRLDNAVRPRSATAAGRAPGLQAGRHLRGRVRNEPPPTCIRPTRTSAKPSRRIARRRSWCSVAGPTGSARASSSTTAACTLRWRCAKTATRPSWSTATPRPCRPTTTLQRPPLLRAAHARRRARDCRQGKAGTGVIVQYGGQTPLKLALGL